MYCELWERVVALLFPCRCVLCGDITAFDDMWCGQCEVHRIEVQSCGDVDGIDGSICALAYKDDVRKAVLRIKHHDDRRIFKFFAEEMYRTVKENLPDIEFDLLIAVPANSVTMKKRGFNQAERIAEELSKLMKVELCTDALLRHDKSRTQHKLNAEQRRENAEKSYDINNADIVKDKTVLIVDDVFTTGSTLRVCGEKLTAAGVREVYTVTATKTVPE